LQSAGGERLEKSIFRPDSRNIIKAEEPMRALRHGRSIADWLFPSVSDLIFLCLFFWALRHGVQFLADGDTGWHIITGNGILDTLSVPYADPYSYTMPAALDLARVVGRGRSRPSTGLPV
jgi:hypothetical protein